MKQETLEVLNLCHIELSDCKRILFDKIKESNESDDYDIQILSQISQVLGLIEGIIQYNKVINN